jgi:hypothetical protein
MVVWEYEQRVETLSVVYRSYDVCRLALSIAWQTCIFPQSNEWPPRPPDSLLWGHRKGNVYKNNPHTLEELKETITTATISFSVHTGAPQSGLKHGQKGSHMHYWTGSPFWAYVVKTWFDLDLDLRLWTLFVSAVCLVDCALNQHCLLWCARLFDHPV